MFAQFNTYLLSPKPMQGLELRAMKEPPPKDK